MKKIVEYVLVAIFVGTVPLLAGSVDTGKFEQGKNLYNNKCQLCHGMKGDGNGPAGSFLSPKPTDFTNPKFWQNDDEKKIAETIMNGKGEMPSFDLKPDEIKDVIDYMSHIFKPGG